MREELELKLRDKYPNLLKNMYTDPRRSCMAWGLECDDGWYTIIDELFEKLDSKNVVLAQVKEKYGSLRVYLESYPDGADTLVDEAEKKSAETCELCGQPGKIVGKAWLKCLCPAHAKSYQG